MDSECEEADIMVKDCRLLDILQYVHIPYIYNVYNVCYIYIYIGKAVPLQAWSGPEGSRKLRFPDFMTTAQDGGKVSLAH